MNYNILIISKLNILSSKNKISYKNSGVDIALGEKLVDYIKPLAKKTFRNEVLNEIGGFSSLFNIPKNYKKPVLVSSTDGVGTKIEIAEMLDNHKTIGIDLVAMCVNDLLTSGAEPLFFLDYLVTEKIDLKKSKDIISGIVKGCKISNCSLIGGETAEHPKNFPKNKYDLAGFSVGVIEKEKIKKIKYEKKDLLIGLKSSGLHSNGFSLIRELLKRKKIKLSSKLGSKSLGKILLEPTKIYVKEIKQLSKFIDIKAMAHITGGGLLGNLERIACGNYDFELDKNKLFFYHKKLFELLMAKASLSNDEMLRTFNCGYGMILVIKENELKKGTRILKKYNQSFQVIGRLKKSNNESQIKII